jgi:hypothetical protein
VIHLPLGAHVACSDGDAGESSALIVDPETLQATHLVVKEKARPHVERLVPAEKVAETTHDSVRLRCTRAELNQMRPFVVTTHRLVETPQFAGGSFGTNPYYAPETVEEQLEQIPEDEVSLRKGLRVEATDGKVGNLDELISDEASGEITHFELHKGHLWGSKRVLVPLEVVDHVGQDRHGESIVYLKLDQQTLSSYLDASEGKQSA